MTGVLFTGIAHGLTGALGDGERFAGALRIRDGRIAATGDLAPEPGERAVDATNALVCPGFVNTHHHLFQSLLKAIPDGLNDSLDRWLMKVPFTWWPHHDEATFRISARVGLVELALSGCSTVCDHHYIWSDRFDFDPAEVLFDEATKMGLRFVLARGGATKSRAFDDPALPPPPVETLDGYLASTMAAADRWHDPAPDAMTRVAVAPTTPTFNVEPGQLAEIAQAARARGLRLHSHLSENGAYVDFTMAKYGRRPVDWLADHGWLGPDVWFAHLVHLDAGEVSVLAVTGTGMAHCPQANARLGSGIAPADALQALGGVVSLAVDGAAANEAADMGAALYSAFTLHRASKGVAAARAETVLHWATMGGARVLGLPGIGHLAPGMAADIAVIDLTAPRYMGQHDVTVGPVISGGGLHVRHLFVAGREVVRDGQIPGLDLAALSDDARRATRTLIQRKEGTISATPRARAAHA